ncbi:MULTISPECIES: DUF6634 family protein [unclassified Sinorhizobium]|uniref:DUF6634 family protein n=1 Tax=unclassified Sinorhizobium TaxID=2613772 RepID=UPI0024C282A9|nr:MULTISPECIES: DUF6634 family protein [unclassified Sinorhizobium]MDK1376835.1 hypothetical protein [Sinorhizobium sp. 6-70]MDK1481064.1 hypothetical protein [Sinorhizobium sp. 6-117]
MTFRFDSPAIALQLFEALRRLDDGTLDVSAVLAEAPTISGYKLVLGWSHALSGVVHGHPRLQDGNKIVTSQLFYLDPQLGLARTMNRWYRLGGSRHGVQ